MKRVSDTRAEWLDQYKKLINAYTPFSCTRCGFKGRGWKHQGGDFEPHHPFRRRTREFMCVFLPLCNECHVWIHANTKQAAADGWLVSPRKTFLNIE